MWVPFETVRSQPLALLVPKSTDISADSADVASFHPALPTDRTGLKFNKAQQWVWFPQMQPGDMLLWKSEVVYHASFALPQQHLQPELHPPRRSIDLRIYFEQPGPPNEGAKCPDAVEKAGAAPTTAAA
jgi:hypothetical protein